MKIADSFYKKYNLPKLDRSSGVYTKDDLLDFAEAFATERNQEIINMIDEMEEKKVNHTKEVMKETWVDAKTESRLWSYLEGVKEFATEIRSRL